MIYLDNFDNIPWTDNFRIKLHVGFAGGESHRGVGDAVCPCEFGLYVVNTGSAGHPRDLRQRMTKIPLTQDPEDPIKGTQGVGLTGKTQVRPPSQDAGLTTPRCKIFTSPRTSPREPRGYKQWFFPNSGTGDQSLSRWQGPRPDSQLC